MIYSHYPPIPTEYWIDQFIICFITPVNIVFFKIIKSNFLFPLDCCRGFATDIVDHTIDAVYFIDDSIRYATQ